MDNWGWWIRKIYNNIQVPLDFSQKLLYSIIDKTFMKRGEQDEHNQLGEYRSEDPPT